MIKGVLFDMDGVLADSEKFICQAAILMFRELGLTVHPEDFKPFTGTGENRYIGGVAEKYNLIIDIGKVKARTYEIYTEIISGNLKPLPGAVSFVKSCISRGFKIAVATSADEIKMNANLKEIGIPSSLFNATVNGLEVQNKKPSPDIYIAAAEKIGLNPDECLVIEDAVSGIKAAKAAGCKCLALTTSFDASQLEEADWICENLESVPEESLNW
ncbi:MAG TPA: HAD-IA family hydrolase [Bacteroidales bacterium]|nr:HAD-IA family hydrolase [Bacteroidales bacterium]